MNLSELVQYVLNNNCLYARQWVQDSIHMKFDWSTVKEPSELEGKYLIVAAAITNLFAKRNNVSPPKWIKKVMASNKPIWLIRQDMPRLSKRVEKECPESLRSYNVYAPSNYLTLV